MKTSLRCKQFLIQNGWTYDPVSKIGSGAYIKGTSIAIDFGDDEIVLLDDTGDFLHLPMNYYALVGALIEFRQLPLNYQSIGQSEGK